MLTIYTDGACDPNPGFGGWGWTRSDGQEAFGGEIETTSNRMELTAILEAITSLPDGQPAMVLSDSRYCINGITSWMHRWEKNQWHKSIFNGKPAGEVKNVDLWQRMFAEVKARPHIQFLWVKGHVGVAGNERADELAEIGRMSAIDQMNDAVYVPTALEGMRIE